MHILLLAATAMESAALFGEVRDQRAIDVPGADVLTGSIDDVVVTAVRAGIGIANTAHALTVAIGEYRPDIVLQFGVGGAYLTSGLGIGDIALAEEEAYGDLGVMTPEGWKSSEAIGIPLVSSIRDDEVQQRCFNTFPLNIELVQRAKDGLATCIWNGNPPGVISGTFVTVQQCSGLAAVGTEVSARFDGICENMEGAAAAQLCLIYQIPFLEIRTISNLVEDRNVSEWNLPLAISRLGPSVRAIIQSIGRE